MTRTISVSEAAALFDCEAKHAFGYTGHLTDGTALRAKNPAITLRRGRAWGAAVAAWHATGDKDIALEALKQAADEDASEQQAGGVYVYDEHVEFLTRLVALLDHYILTTERLPLTDAELELRCPLPSRTGRRSSNRYVFVGHLDGLTRDDMGLWVVEFKLRGRLSSFEQIAWMRQVRWYAWAAERTLGEPVQGVIVDERLNEIPKPARWVKGRGKDAPDVPSHAKDQMCTAEAYVDACAHAGVDVVQETFDALNARRWQSRHRVMLRRDEIDRAGRELVSAGRLVAEMDAGERFPVANPSPMRCPGCAFREVCARPSDLELIDVNFERIEAKRNRSEETTAVSAPPLPLEQAA